MALVTHYDNLKISRNAPAEVIRAAYKALAQKEHPDRNSSPDAAKNFQIISAAYAALSDPITRAQHDEWIRQQEVVAQRYVAPEPPARKHAETYNPAPEPASFETSLWPVFKRFMLHLAVAVLMLVLLTYIVNTRETARTSLVSEAIASATEASPALASGFAADVVEAASFRLIVDATKIRGFAYVKLLDLTSLEIVRTADVAGGSRFAFESLPAGRYVLKYMHNDSCYSTAAIYFSEDSEAETSAGFISIVKLGAGRGLHSLHRTSCSVF